MIQELALYIQLIKKYQLNDEQIYYQEFLDADITENFIENKNKNDYDDEIDSECRKNLIQVMYMLADEDFEILYVSKEKDINELLSYHIK